MSAAKRMLAAFVGSKVAHGTTTVGRIGRNGKAEADSRIVREPLTVEKVQAHLAGKQGIGAIPINADNQCKWGALDIDVYDLDHKALQSKLIKMGLPFIHCRTKSGGAHLYLFLKEYEDAAVVREYLIEFSVALGFSGCEVFPKQDKILTERGDVGNFINLPYFKADETMRYAFNAKGEAIELEEFLDLVETSQVSLADLEAIELGGKRKYFMDGPPCLQHLFAEGPVDKDRNKTLFHSGVYCRLKHPDDWVKEFENINRTLFSPPLEAKEVMNTQKSLEKKDYFYLCEQEPFKSFCDKQLCMSRPYGIGNGEVPMPQIGGLTILLSEPRLYFMVVGGATIQLTTEQLQNQTLWQRMCMEQASIMPPSMKPNRWQALVSDLLSKATKLEVPEELTISGEFKELLRQYCTSRIRAMEPAELDLGKPWTENGRTMFKFEGLWEFLRQRHFTHYKRAEIQEQLKKLNNGGECHGHKSIPRDGGARGTVRVWWVPAFEEEEYKLNVEEINNDIPF